MDLLDIVKNNLKIEANIEESKNYYFENHNCPKTGDNIRINLDYKISCETSDEIIKIGKCPNCSAIIYHRDFES
ncbi:MAG: hypothetical protein IJ736_07120 [Firmicutes bacterium]|nr:hypothetical protein [Bacillota bacterium]